ncbi:hypothetical protein KBK19_14360 [Microvirga sp. STR05]|uniref:Uncharacterized protein n=1 Tax=Hymenobacter duratus TaxID=2771356 RepID=A0ABR8JKR8_9BACT|nr:hypothetical protein [Hymenobacter duratus]MBD2716221.1 hypothetical protein [Hymenobacter duratus]MBR7951135.1 hypothetical protein [Microvirga sp. STR05]
MNADIYVLANNRKKENVLKALDKYLPNRSYQLGKQDGQFEFWNDSNQTENQPSIFFKSESDLFGFLDSQNKILFRPSFRSTTESEFRALTLYYFEDNSLVFGLNMYQDSIKEELVLSELKELLESKYGYIAYHVPPAYGKEAFIKQCKNLK